MALPIPRPHWKIPKKPPPLWRRALLAFLDALTVFGGARAAGAGRLPQFLRPLRNMLRVREAQAATLPQEQRAETPAAARTHTVAKGDTLWKIAAAVYGRGERWIDIWQANRERMSEPNLIHVGQVLEIPSQEVRRPGAIAPAVMATEAGQPVKPATKTPAPAPANAKLQQQITEQAELLTQSLGTLMTSTQAILGGVADPKFQGYLTEAQALTDAMVKTATTLGLIDSVASLLDVARGVITIAMNSAQIAKAAPAGAEPATAVKPVAVSTEKASQERLNEIQLLVDNRQILLPLTGAIPLPDSPTTAINAQGEIIDTSNNEIIGRIKVPAAAPPSGTASTAAPAAETPAAPITGATTYIPPRGTPHLTPSEVAEKGMEDSSDWVFSWAHPAVRKYVTEAVIEHSKDCLKNPRNFNEMNIHILCHEFALEKALLGAELNWKTLYQGVVLLTPHAFAHTLSRTAGNAREAGEGGEDHRENVTATAAAEVTMTDATTIGNDPGAASAVAAQSATAAAKAAFAAQAAATHATIAAPGSQAAAVAAQAATNAAAHAAEAADQAKIANEAAAQENIDAAAAAAVASIGALTATSANLTTAQNAAKAAQGDSAALAALTGRQALEDTAVAFAAAWDESRAAAVAATQAAAAEAAATTAAQAAAAEAAVTHLAAAETAAAAATQAAATQAAAARAAASHAAAAQAAAIRAAVRAMADAEADVAAATTRAEALARAEVDAAMANEAANANEASQARAEAQAVAEAMADIEAKIELELDASGTPHLTLSEVAERELKDFSYREFSAGPHPATLPYIQAATLEYAKNCFTNPRNFNKAQIQTLCNEFTYARLLLGDAYLSYKIISLNSTDFRDVYRGVEPPGTDTKNKEYEATLEQTLAFVLRSPDDTYIYFNANKMVSPEGNDIAGGHFPTEQRRWGIDFKIRDVVVHELVHLAAKNNLGDVNGDKEWQTLSRHARGTVTSDYVIEDSAEALAEIAMVYMRVGEDLSRLIGHITIDARQDIWEMINFLQRKEIIPLTRPTAENIAQAISKATGDAAVAAITASEDTASEAAAASTGEAGGTPGGPSVPGGIGDAPVGEASGKDGAPAPAVPVVDLGTATTDGPTASATRQIDTITLRDIYGHTQTMIVLTTPTGILVSPSITPPRWSPIYSGPTPMGETTISTNLDSTTITFGKESKTLDTLLLMSSLRSSAR